MFCKVDQIIKMAKWQNGKYKRKNKCQELILIFHTKYNVKFLSQKNSIITLSPKCFSHKQTEENQLIISPIVDGSTVDQKLKCKTLLPVLSTISTLTEHSIRTQKLHFQLEKIVNDLKIYVWKKCIFHSQTVIDKFDLYPQSKQL